MSNYSADHDDYTDERGEYVKCPVCGSADLYHGEGEDPWMWVTSCNSCGQTISDSYIGGAPGDTDD